MEYKFRGGIVGGGSGAGMGVQYWPEASAPVYTVGSDQMGCHKRLVCRSWGPMGLVWAVQV